MRKSFVRSVSVFMAALICLSGLGIAASAAEIGESGSFNFLVQNVAGLPIPAAYSEDGSDAFDDTIEMGAKLNELAYDIAVLQEDFNYDIYLREQLTVYADEYSEDGKQLLYRHGTEHMGGVPMGDGLDTFSTYRLYNTDRQAWDVASGILTDLNDELTPKGFSVTTIEIADGYYLDVYNMHADAGGSENDRAAREAQYIQLAEYIMKHSVYDENTGVYDHAVIVGGDFNTYISAEDTAASAKFVENLIEAAHLNDAWAVATLETVEENLGGTEEFSYEAYYTYAANDTYTGPDEWTYRLGHYDSAERILYAGGNGIELSLTDFSYGWILRDSDSQPLSDHPYAAADFQWTIVEKAQDTDYNHDDIETDAPRGFLFRFLAFIQSIIRAIGKLFKDHGNAPDLLGG